MQPMCCTSTVFLPRTRLPRPRGDSCSSNATDACSRASGTRTCTSHRLPTLQYLKDHPEIIDGVRLGARIYHSGIQGGIGLWSIVTTLFLRINQRQAEQFAEHLTTGAGLHRGHPVLLLRNRLLGSQRDQYSTLSGREAVVAIELKAWNAWGEGKRWRGVPKAAGPNRFRKLIERRGWRAPWVLDERVRRPPV